jgi:hypothetical protein
MSGRAAACRLGSFPGFGHRFYMNPRLFSSPPGCGSDGALGGGAIDVVKGNDGGRSGRHLLSPLVSLLSPLSPCAPSPFSFSDYREG